MLLCAHAFGKLFVPHCGSARKAYALNGAQPERIIISVLIEAPINYDNDIALWRLRVATKGMQLIGDAQSLVGLLQNAHGWELSPSRVDRVAKNVADTFFSRVSELSDDLDEVVINHAASLPLLVDEQIHTLRRLGLGVYAGLHTERHPGIGGRESFAMTTVVICLQKQKDLPNHA